MDDDMEMIDENRKIDLIRQMDGIGRSVTRLRRKLDSSTFPGAL